MLTKKAIQDMLERYQRSTPTSICPQSIENLNGLYLSLFGDTLNEVETAKFAAYFYAAHHGLYKDKPDDEQSLSFWSELADYKDAFLCKYTKRGAAFYQLDKNGLINKDNVTSVLGLSLQKSNELAKIFDGLRGEEGSFLTLWFSKESLLTQDRLSRLFEITREQGTEFCEQVKRARNGSRGYDYLAKNIDTILGANNPAEIIELLSDPMKKHEIWPVYESKILTHAKPISAAIVYTKLHTLDPAYVPLYADRMLASQNKYSRIWSLEKLHAHFKKRSEPYINCMLNCADAYSAVNVLIELDRKGFLGLGEKSSALVAQIFSHKNIISACNAIIKLNSNVNPKIRQYEKQIFAHPDPEGIVTELILMEKRVPKEEYERRANELLTHPNPSGLSCIWFTDFPPATRAFVVLHPEISEHKKPLLALRALEKLHALGLMKYKDDILKGDILKQYAPHEAVDAIELLLSAKLAEREFASIVKLILHPYYHNHEPRGVQLLIARDFITLRDLYIEAYNELVPTLLDAAVAKGNDSIIQFPWLIRRHGYFGALGDQDKRLLMFLIKNIEEAGRLTLAYGTFGNILPLLEQPEKVTQFLRFIDCYIGSSSPRRYYIERLSMQLCLEHLDVLLHPKILQITDKLPAYPAELVYPVVDIDASPDHKKARAFIMSKVFAACSAARGDLEKAVNAVIEALSCIIWKHPALALLEEFPVEVVLAEVPRPLSSAQRHTFLGPAAAGAGKSSGEDGDDELLGDTPGGDYVVTSSIEAAGLRNRRPA